jgi:DNA-binding MarR family transcriptional regulator
MLFGMASESPPGASGLLEERRSSPGLLLALLGHDAMRRLRDAHTAHDLKPRQFQLLGLLHDHGPMGQRELGHAMDTDPSVLVTLLNPLEADGFVARNRDPEDRRRHVVTLTAAGKRQLDRAAQAQREVEDAIFAGLDAGQRAQLRDLLVALRDSRTDGRVDDACSSRFTEGSVDPPEDPRAGRRGRRGAGDRSGGGRGRAPGSAR